MKIIKKIQMKIVIFTPVKNRCMLHGRVFVMRRIIKEYNIGWFKWSSFRIFDYFFSLFLL